MFLHRIKNLLLLKIKREINKVPHIYPKNENIHKDANIGSASIIGNVEIGESVNIFFDNVYLDGKIKIGSFTTLNGPNLNIMSNINQIEIGKFCSIARNVNIQESYHNYNRISTYFIFRNIFKENNINETISKGPIKIGNDVWIGAGVTILSGVSIGDEL